MAFYRMGMRLKMTRTVQRAMNRNKSTTTIQRMMLNRTRYADAVARPLAAAVADTIDMGLAFHAAEFLFFNDGGEDDDGTPMAMRFGRYTTNSLVPFQ